MKYFEELHNLHEKWLSNTELLPAPLLVIDANVDLKENPNAYSKYDKDILRYYKSAKTNKVSCLNEINGHMNHLVI